MTTSAPRTTSRTTPTVRPSRSSPAAPARLPPLRPERDVFGAFDRWTATSDEPWLRIEVEAADFAGRWTELVFDAGLTDVVRRPILRCVTPRGEREQILPAAALGRARWIGKIPSQTAKILISPVNEPGPFSFRLVAARPLSLPELAARGLPARPKYVALGLGYRWVGDAFESERCFRRALHSAPLRAMGRWAGPRRRPAEWDGFDRTDATPEEGPLIRIVAADADAAAVGRLLAWLESQPWRRWSLAGPADAARPGVLAFDARAPFAACLAGLAADDLALCLRRGDRWAPETLAVAGAAAIRGDSDLFYADETAGGRLRLKPDWSPLFARSADLVGRAWIARAGWLRAALGDRSAALAAAAPLPIDETVRATHLRRVLLEGGPAPAPVARPCPRPASAAAAADRPGVSIVIPTRDHCSLLRRCVDSLGGAGGRTEFETIVVDNGTREPDAVAYLDALGRDPRRRVLRRSGPFNFSALCNAGAAAARASTLVFLNNDIEAPASNWLDLLAGWARLPTIGAVGAKLVYPDGRLQHAGVVLGIDGHASHFERFRHPDQPGFFGRFHVPHEISAVTGACLAVEKHKFDAVGGFDEVNLPVEFSDIDLCLRLAERGWTALVEPAARLVHREAATRGVWRSQEKRYADEVAYFKARWRTRLRDDPYFHPALSLDWHDAALG